MTVFKKARRWAGDLARRPAFAPLGRLHRDERGAAMLEYAMVFTVIALMLMLLFYKMFHVLTDYFGMIAFFVTWPFI